MEKNEARLGWALAHLQTGQSGTSLTVSGPESGYLTHIQERYRQLHSDGQLLKILDRLPGQPCLIDRPFLEGNEDFFIALFSNTKHDEACIRLYKHMNDCYPCFEIFSQVLRDYYQQGEALRTVSGEKQNG
jgi:hypothetical protein